MRIGLHAAALTVAAALAGTAWGQNGVITLQVDLRDAPQKLIHATETIPVKPGPMVLAYPEWIPGEHAPDGPIANQAGFLITGNGQPIKWERDPVEMYSYHIVVPAGVSELNIKMDFITAATGGEFTAGGSTSENLAVLSWNTVLVYPYSSPAEKVTSISVSPSIDLPAGWKFATALEGTDGPILNGGNGAGGATSFKIVSLEQLIDSPVLSGRFFREVPLAPDVTPKHYLDMAGDSPDDVNISQEHIDEFSKLVHETGALYKSRHYTSYHFLVTLSDETSHFGLEHHQSSDDRVGPDTFTNDRVFTLSGLLLPHEFTHSWNGKYRRPAGLATPNYQVPMGGDGLWVYEGLTEYLGDVLAARSGIWTQEQYRDRLATVAATLNNRPGRTWRDLQDTATMAQILYLHGGPYDNWRRSTDFYDEGELLWLDVDTTIRNRTNGAKSLNDFVALFHGLNGNTPPEVIPYTFEDIVKALNTVCPYDWAQFLRFRLDTNRPEAPLGGLEGGGYKLIYKDTMNPWSQLQGGVDFWYSLGLQINGNGTLGDVEVGGVAYKAGFGPGMKLVAINGRAFSDDVLRDALQKGVSTSTPMEFIVENTGFYRVLHVDYHGGEKFPWLIRVDGTPDRMDEITKPLTQ